MILFVGDKPSPKMKPGAKPFQGAACEKRLMKWIKTLTREEYAICNTTDEHFIRWIQWMEPVIALGNNASKKLTDGKVPHFKLPHPSGRNRQLNDKEFIELRLSECKEWLNNDR